MCWQVLGALGVVLAVMGFNMGCIDCLANLKMIQLYGEAVAPFLQVLWFEKKCPRIHGVYHVNFTHRGFSFSIALILADLNVFSLIRYKCLY